MDIILLEPETAGNVGAVARVMKNFGFQNLVLANPKCDYKSQEARDRAKHANDILKQTKIIKKNELRKYYTLIGTTAQLGTDYNIPRSPLTPEQLSKIIHDKKNVGVLFGREGSGLSNKEIELCDFVVTIPTSKKYPTMNLSHSVAVICYELSRTIGGMRRDCQVALEHTHKYRHTLSTSGSMHTGGICGVSKHNENITSHIRFASQADKKQLIKMINEQLNKMKFSNKTKKETQKRIWKRIIAKSFLTKREAFGLMGFFRKLN